jgi:hypothetical protein
MAAIAHVRHDETYYDDLPLARGRAPGARDRIREDVERVLSGDSSTRALVGGTTGAEIQKNTPRRASRPMLQIKTTIEVGDDGG